MKYSTLVPNNPGIYKGLIPENKEQRPFLRIIS